MHVDNLLDRSDELMHYGTPRHSGRYPWGSGERPFQGDGLPQGVRITKKGKIEITTSGNKPREVDPNSDDAVKQLAMHFVSIDPEAMKEFNKNFSKNLEETGNVYQSVVDDKYKGTILPERDMQTESLSDYEARLSKLPGKELAYYLESEAAMDNAWTDTWRIEYAKAAKKKIPEAERFLEEAEKHFKSLRKAKRSQEQMNRIRQFQEMNRQHQEMHTQALNTHHEMHMQALNTHGQMMGMWSDEEGEDFMYVDNLLDRSDELMHYGTPRHSGRYPWGSGERPFQRQGSTRLHNYMSSDKLNSIHKQEEKKILKEAGYSSREELKNKFMNGVITGNTIEFDPKDVKVLTELRKLDKEYDKASKKSKRLDKHVDMTMNNMGRFWNFDEYATADARAKRKINDYEKKEGHKLTPDEKQRVLLEEYRKIKKRRTALAVGSAAAGVAAATVAPELLLSPLAYVYYSDTDQNAYMAALLDKADDLEHYGTPRHSGRYPWGSGERPFQGDDYLALPLASGEYHYSHNTSRSTRKAKAGAQNSSAGSSNSSSSSSSNTGASSQYDAYKAEEAQYKRNEERRKQQRHDADMADRARKIRKEDAKEKADKEKADKKEREDLEDAYWKEVTNMTSQLASIRTHAKNLKAASKPVKDVTKKMSDQQLKELTDRLKLENSYLRELNTKQGYMAQPDKLDNFIGLMGDITSMGRSASKVYRTANKQRKYL